MGPVCASKWAEGRTLTAVSRRRATPRQVREILLAQVGNVLEFIDEPEAAQYRQSQAHHDVT